MGSVRPSTPSGAARLPRAQAPVASETKPTLPSSMPSTATEDADARRATGGAQAEAGATAVQDALKDAARDPKGPTQSTDTKDTPAAKPSVTDRLEEARTHTAPATELRNLPPEDQKSIRDSYAAEQSKLYDAIATDLEEQGRPTREDFTVNGKFLSWEYQEALSYYDGQLEEAQQGAKPERERQMRAELAQTPAGREMLAFEQNAGVPIKVLTDREWRQAGHDPGTAAFASGDEGITFNVRYLDANTYVHEMTHEVDHFTKVLAAPDDPRTREQVIEEATANYEKYGLDPAEVPALVDATYHQGQDGLTLTHAHTRLAEARLHRQEHGGPALDEAETRQVLSLALPREQDNRAIDIYNETVKNDPDAAPDALGKLREYAETRGIDSAGMSAEDLIARLNERKATLEAAIVAIERAGGGASNGGTGGKGNGSDSGTGGIAGGIGGIAATVGGVLGSIAKGAAEVGEAAGTGGG